MTLVGCDLHSRKQQVAVLDTTTGEVLEQELTHDGDVPIVMITSDDPVEGGLVASFARPGGTVTGLTFVSSDLAGKRLQLLKDAAPRVTRVGVLWNPEHPDGEFQATQAGMVLVARLAKGRHRHRPR